MTWWSVCDVYWLGKDGVKVRGGGGGGGAEVETNLKSYLHFSSHWYQSGQTELTLWPGIMKWDLRDELSKSGLSSNLLIHLFQRLIELMK